MKKAFTLAEILITLAIIGIVAAIAIPDILLTIQHRDFVTKLLKMQNILSTAYRTQFNGYDKVTNVGSKAELRKKFEDVFINVTYDDDDSRNYEFINIGEKDRYIIEGLK